VEDTLELKFHTQTTGGRYQGVGQNIIGGGGHCFFVYQKCFYSPVSSLGFGASSFSLLIVGYMGVSSAWGKVARV